MVKAPYLVILLFAKTHILVMIALRYKIAQITVREIVLARSVCANFISMEFIAKKINVTV